MIFTITMDDKTDEGAPKRVDNSKAAKEKREYAAGAGGNDYWKQAVPIDIGKLNELSIFARYGEFLGTDAGNISIWERQNEIVCSPWNWAKTMSTGSAGILEGGVEAQYLNMGRSMDTVWVSRISRVAKKGKLSCMEEFDFALKGFRVLLVNLWQPLLALPALLYVAVVIAREFDSSGGFLVIALFNDVMFGEEMELLRFYYGGKIKWALTLDFGFWDFLKRDFRDAVGEESDIVEAITVQDEADFGRRHWIHRFILQVFQVAVTYAEYCLVIGSGLSELLADIFWDPGGAVEDFDGGDNDPVTGQYLSEESTQLFRRRCLIPGVIGVSYSIVIFWILVIFEIVFIYFCVIVVPRTTGKEKHRTAYGDVIAGISKGRVVFRGCALSRLWLWTRGYVKKTNDKRGNVVDPSDELKTFMVFLHWLGDNGWISARMDRCTICKIQAEGMNTQAFLEDQDDDDDEKKYLITKKEKTVDANILNPMTEAPGFKHQDEVGNLELTESVKGASSELAGRITSVKSRKKNNSRKSRMNSVNTLFEHWLEGNIDTKERAAFGFSEYLVGTVSWLLGVEQILFNVGHQFDANGNEDPIYKIYDSRVDPEDLKDTAHRWLFDGKAAVRDRIGDTLIRGGLCHWLKLAIAYDENEMKKPYKDGDLGLMVFGGVSETHELRKQEIYELDELKSVLGRKVRAKWLAGGILIITRDTRQINEQTQLATTTHYAPSVTFGTAELEEIRRLGKLWLQETARWRELVQKWDMSSQNAVIFGQEQVTTRRGNRIVAAILSVEGEVVTVRVRKTLLPLESQGNDIFCIS